jgi:ETC complex I subunit conserved region
MKALIYQPAKNAMQSARGNSEFWVLEYEALTDRRPEPLMGWVASGDTLNQVKLKFPTLEEATNFADKKGFQYTVQVPQVRKVRPRNYGDNFKYEPPTQDD